jgi:hypothetical protein
MIVRPSNSIPAARARRCRSRDHVLVSTVDDLARVHDLDPSGREPPNPGSTRPVALEEALESLRHLVDDAVLVACIRATSRETRS